MTKRMNSKMRALYNRYIKAEPCTELWEVYGTYSKAKQNALDWCKAQCYYDGGQGFKIVSHNTNMFTCGWTFTDEDGNPCFRYETHKNTYTCIIGNQARKVSVE